MTPTEIAEKLGQSGLCVCPGYLTPRALREAREDLKSIQNAGGFQRAGVGHGTGHDIRNEIRSDEVHWFDPGGLDSHKLSGAQTSLLAGFEVLKTAFNRCLYLGITDFEGHYASYSKGGYYRRHLDVFSDSSDRESSRMVSVVLYLNENWQEGDGGELRIHDGESHQDIQPIGGTLVCFMSRESEHEVLMSHAPRLSVTGWFVRSRELIR